MIRTHKIALNPSPMQLRLLERHAAHARDAYNWALACFNDTLDAGRPYPVGMLFPMWEGARASLHPQSDELCQSAAKYAVMALAKAIAAWQDNARDNQFPRFRNPDDKAAFRADKGAGTVRCEGKRIELPSIGSVRMHESLRFEGRVPMVTVTHEAERWWACVAVEMRNPLPCPGDKIIGVDVGLGTIAVCSDGTRYAIPEALKSLRREIGRLTRRLARQVEGSGHHERVRRQLQKARYRARCLRDEAQHRAANEIVAKARMVVMEGLDVPDMMNQSGRCLASGIARAAMRSLQYKIACRCAAAGVRFVNAAPRFPDTRMCSGCGGLQDMPLRKGVCECLGCGLVLYRDLNAAVNLRQYGEAQSL